MMKTEKKAPQPLHIGVMADKQGRKFDTLLRPFVIHYPAKGIIPANRTARKTFAINFMNEEILIACTRCSKKDQYSRKIGLRVAVGRLKKLQENYLVNGSYDPVFIAANPFAKIVSVPTALTTRVFETCTIPAEVLKYALEIYERFQVERGGTSSSCVS